MFTSLKVSAKSDGHQGLVGRDKNFKSVNNDRLQLLGNFFLNNCFLFEVLSSLSCILETDKMKEKRSNNDCRLQVELFYSYELHDTI